MKRSLGDRPPVTLDTGGALGRTRMSFWWRVERVGRRGRPNGRRKGSSRPGNEGSRGCRGDGLARVDNFTTGAYVVVEVNEKVLNAGWVEAKAEKARPASAGDEEDVCGHVGLLSQLFLL